MRHCNASMGSAVVIFRCNGLSKNARNKRRQPQQRYWNLNPANVRKWILARDPGSSTKKQENGYPRGFSLWQSAWRRHQYAEIVRRQDVITWLGCHRRALEFFGGVPSKILVDNCKCAITRACYHDPEVQRAYGEFAEGYGFMISACPPYDPQKKGRVESGVKYVKNNFVPLREFRNLASSNRELMHWVLTVAGNRIHGSTYEKPLIRFEIEKKLLKPLPEKPVELVCWAKVKVHGDCHVQFAKCRYSVP